MSRGATARELVVATVGLVLAFAASGPAARAGWRTVGTAGFSSGTASYTSMGIPSTNGYVYVAYSDGANGGKATVMYYSGTTWQTLGTAGFSAGTATYTSLAIGGGLYPYVAYQDGGNGGKATAKYYSGSWMAVGSAGFTSGTATYTSLAQPSHTSYVAYSDGANVGKATVMSYAGTWSIVGSAGFSAGTASYISLVFYGTTTPYVAYQDGGNSNKATVKYYTAGSWQTVGSAGFSAGQADYLSLAFNGATPYVVYSDGANGGKATVMTYNGSSWQTVGSAGFSAGSAACTALAFYNSEPYVAYSDAGNSGKATLMRYTAGSWQNVGSAGFSAGTATYTSLAFYNGVPYVAYRDGGNGDKATVMRFVGPMTQATNVTFSSVGSTSATVGWTRGNGTACAVFMKQASSGSAAPVDNTTYTANAAFGSGSQIGATGWYCIYRGTGTSVGVTGLSSATTYRVMVCEYTGVAGSEGYLTTSATGNPANVTTVPAAPTATAATGVTASGFSANWNASTGATGYRLDVATDSGFTSFVTGYQNLDVAGVTTYAVSGLEPGTTYHYRVRAYNGSGTSGNSNTIDVLSVPAAPVATAATDLTATGFSANWNVSTGATGYRLDVATDSGFTGFVTGYQDLDVAAVTTFAVSGLEPGTAYYYRVRAYNASGTGDGSNTRAVTTAATTPTVTTAAVTGITPTSATCGGEVTADGGDSVTHRGACWSTTGNPTIADSKTADGTGLGIFTSSLTGLSPGTTYHVRGYATNSAGTAYGSEDTFTTVAVHTVTFVAGANGSLSGTTAQTVNHGGNCTPVTAAPDTSYHFTGWTGDYVGSDNPLTVTNVTADITITANFAIDTHTVTFVAGAHGSLAGTTTQTVNHGGNCTPVTAVPDGNYHFTGWTGDYVGPDNPLTITDVTGNMTIMANFTTNTTPNVTTAVVSDITTTTATCGGDISADGGASVTARGVCWNTAGGPTVADNKTTDGSGTGAFVSSLTGLSPGATYHVRAYASNSAGTTYGAETYFTTVAADTGDNAADDSSPRPDLLMTITSLTEAAEVGADLAFQVAVENVGGASASGVRLRVPLPPGTEFVSARLLADQAGSATPLNAQVEQDQIVIELGALAGGGNLAIELVLRVQAAGTVTLQGSAAYDESATPATARADADVQVADAYWEIVNTVVPIHVCGFLGVTPLFAFLGLIGLKRRGWARRGS